jgi:hypothetical protein
LLQGGAAADIPAPLPLTDTTQEAANAANVENGNATPTTPKDGKPRTPRQPRQRGPPEDGIPSKNKVMVANLPYDLSEEKVSLGFLVTALITDNSIAEGAFQCLQSLGCQDRSAPHSPFHGQEAAGSW